MSGYDFCKKCTFSLACFIVTILLFTFDVRNSFVFNVLLEVLFERNVKTGTKNRTQKVFPSVPNLKGNEFLLDTLHLGC